jgi:hypothetical protein
MDGSIMKLQLNPAIASQAIPGSPQVGRLPDAAAAPGDDIRISSAVAALDWSAKIGRVTASVQSGAYQASSVATSNALIEDALSDY